MMETWMNRAYDWITAICEATHTGPARHLVTDPPLPGEWAGQGSMAPYLAGSHVILAGTTGDDKHYDIALDYLLLPEPVHCFAASAAFSAVSGIRDAGRFSDEQDEAVSRTMREITRRNNDAFNCRQIGIRRSNHSVTTAALCDVVARLWPDAQDAEFFREQADDVWDEWWTIGDNSETAANYEAFAQVELLRWADRRGERERTLSDPMTRQWIERAIEHFLPVGIVPGYGDTCTMELWTDWFGLYCLLAAWGDESYARRARWAAERMFLWAEERRWLDNLSIINDVPDDLYRARQAWTQIPRTAWYLASGLLCLRSAPAVTPNPHPVRPVATYRTIPDQEHTTSGSWSLVAPHAGPRIPDKVIMRLGDAPTDPCAMVGCSRQMWHDHLDGGAILAYAANGTVLLDDSGYMQRYPTFHNLFWVAPAESRWLNYTAQDYDQRSPTDYRVSVLTGGHVAQYALMEADVPHGMPIRHQRVVLLTRSGPLVVLDRVRPIVEGLVGSPLWQTQTVHRTGPGWAEISVDGFRGMNGPAMRNGTEHLLVATPLESGAWSRLQQENKDPYAAPHYQEPVTRYFVYWKKSFVTRTCLSRPKPLEAGTTNAFITVLLPASLAESPKGAVRLIEALTRQSVALSIAGGLLVLSNQDDGVGGTWGQTDARTLWVERGGLFAHRVQKVELPDVRVCCASGRIDLDIAYGDGWVRGAAASAEPTTLTIAVDGNEYALPIRGVTPISVKRG